jgi:hypothetical protein
MLEARQALTEALGLEPAAPWAADARRIEEALR